MDEKRTKRREVDVTADDRREGAAEHDREATGVDRRDLLQLGALGVAGTLAGLGRASAQETAEKAASPTSEASCPQPSSDPGPVRVVVPSDPETWNEPWVWRPSEWPGQQLDLNIVENQNPGVPVGLGNPGSVLFSYGGDTPGPTIRMRGDETLFVKLRNLLGQDFGESFIGPYPHVSDAPAGSAASTQADAKATALGNQREDFCLGEHTNGVHSIRVTNLHTHGLHVRPSRNPDGTHSDNVILRVISQADFNRREQTGAAESCDFLRMPDQISFLRDDEQVGEADYEFRLGDVQRRKREEENRRRARQGKKPLPPQPHPSGTFWYHPHSHGATHNQVASGMAGFLIVEGDIEDAIQRVLVGWKDGDPKPDPSLKSGPYDYRERLMLFQRALNLSVDKDASKKSPGLQGASSFQPLVNGGSTPTVIRMRPGAVERWRVLNGSVDGRGYKRFMVVKGQYTVRLGPDGNFDTYEVLQNGDLRGPLTLANLEEIESKKQDLYQLSVDGVALVHHENGRSRYRIKDLSRQNKGSSNPLWTPDPKTLAELEAWIARQRYSRAERKVAKKGADLYSRLVSVWKSKQSVRDCFVRPNEFYMGPANRTDVFFQAPRRLGRKCTQTTNGEQVETSYEIYTVLAKTVVVHSDTPMQNAQKAITNPTKLPAPEDVVVAWVLVEDDGDGSAADRRADLGALMHKLEQALPPVQEYLKPVDDRELQVTEEEIAARPGELRAGDHRTRRVLYSGWGHPNMPLVSTYPLKLDSRRRRNDPATARAFVDYINDDPLVTFELDGKKVTQREHENLIYTEYPVGSGYYVLLAPELRTMAISLDNPRTDQERPSGVDPSQLPWAHPELPRKFNPSDPYRARMLENTAEEWTLYNLTNPLFGNVDTSSDGAEQSVDPTRPDYKQPPTQYNGHFVAYPLSRRCGQELFLENKEFQYSTKGIDHPFHVHQNPFWVTRIEIPDENGDLVNILDEPRWMDSIWIPRNRGRVVFRMRFPDFVGAYVHHCHILLHEDNGMMHVIEATPFADESNYTPRRSLAPAPRPTPEESYRTSLSFCDPNMATGQVYPGFEVTAPELPEESLPRSCRQRLRGDD